MSRQFCPQCGTARSAAGALLCPCAQRAAEDVRQRRQGVRSADMAAAEDFDPLRIRPYVELSGSDDTGAGEPSPAATTQPQARPGVQQPGAASAAGAAGGSAPGPAPAVAAAPCAGEPWDSPGADQAPPGDLAQEPHRSSRRRRAAVATATGAAAAVAGVAVFASGLFTYEKPHHDDALSDPDTRSSAPDPAGDVIATHPAATVGPAARPTASVPVQRVPKDTAPPPLAAASVTDVARASGTVARPPAPGRSGGDTSTAPGTPAAPAPDAPVTTPPPSADTPPLGLGDSGPLVAELQRRLQQISLFAHAVDGRFTAVLHQALAVYQWIHGIDDPPGVYGPETRRNLEAETPEVP